MEIIISSQDFLLGAGNWSPDLMHAKQVCYHWVTVLGKQHGEIPGVRLLCVTCYWISTSLWTPGPSHPLLDLQHLKCYLVWTTCSGNVLTVHVLNTMCQLGHFRRQKVRGLVSHSAYKFKKGSGYTARPYLKRTTKKQNCTRIPTEPQNSFN